MLQHIDSMGLSTSYTINILALNGGVRKGKGQDKGMAGPGCGLKDGDSAANDSSGTTTDQVEGGPPPSLTKDGG